MGARVESPTEISDSVALIWWGSESPPNSSLLPRASCLRFKFLPISIQAYYFLKMLECFLISVDSSSKKVNCFLKMLECFLISVDSASKKAYCFLKMLDCLLISVDSASKKADCFLISVYRAFISVDSASKKANCFLNLPFYFFK